jgi:hypothetical protein
VVRHAQPQNPEIRILRVGCALPWDTPNNSLEVEKHRGKKIVAETGKETFEVEINVSLTNGEIISPTIANPVEVLSRDCEVAELSRCGPAKRFQVLRRIEVK